MPAQKTVAIPTFTHGTYPSQSGEPVTFTDELMQRLEKNTNFVINAGVLKPPVGYDHPVWGKARDTDAHGHIAGVRYVNGLLLTDVAQPSDRFRSDVREGRRLYPSGEFVTDFSFVDASGQTVKVGPTIVGLAALGAQRHAVKNPRIQALSELAFGEAVSAADAYATREELRKSGFVAQTLDGTVHAFSEVIIPREALDDEEEHQEDEMDKAEVAQMIAAATEPLKTENAALKQKLDEVSTTGTRVAEAKAFGEKLREDGKNLGKLAMERLSDILADPTIPAPAITKIKAFAESLSPVLLTGEVAGSGKKRSRRNDEDEDLFDDEPEPVALLNTKHFAEMQRGNNEKLIASGLKAYGKWQPEKIRRDGKELPLAQQIKVLQKHVEKRDSAEADA